MKQFIIILILALGLTNDASSQITKNNWMVGGSGSFSQLRSSSTSAAHIKQTDLQIIILLGYFPADKFAIGLNPSLNYANNNFGSHSAHINIGPFARYYFLKSQNVVNLFIESAYSYGSIKANGAGKAQHLHTFSFLGGPVVYFNSSVGMEFTINYKKTTGVGFQGANNEFRLGVGFQFHLEKDR